MTDAPSTPAPEPDYRKMAEDEATEILAELINEPGQTPSTLVERIFDGAVEQYLISAVDAAVKERDRVTVAWLRSTGNGLAKLIAKRIENGDHLPKET